MAEIVRRRSWGGVLPLASNGLPGPDWTQRVMPSRKSQIERATSEPFVRAARRSFGIDAVRIGSETHPVSEGALITLPWAALTAFSHPGVPHRQVLVVAPLSGGFPFLLRDLVVGLL